MKLFLEGRLAGSGEVNLGDVHDDWPSTRQTGGGGSSRFSGEFSVNLSE